MNDDFLYRFRADPPPEFAARLKARLDASVSARRRSVRWGVFTLIFGAALAFALPAVRQSISRLVGLETQSERVPAAPLSGLHLPAPSVSQTAEGASSSPVATETPGSPATLPGGRPVPSSSSVQTKPPTYKQNSRMRGRDGFGFVADAPPMPVFERATSSNDPLPHSSTMLDEAHDAILLRRSLFRVMGRATDDLGRLVFYGDIFENKDAVAAQTARLRELAAMIPEVFVLDTRDITDGTHALPGIWLNPSSFQKEVERLQADLDALEQEARGRMPPRPVLIKNVVASCDRCHDIFRRNDPPGSGR